MFYNCHYPFVFIARLSPTRAVPRQYILKFSPPYLNPIPILPLHNTFRPPSLPKHNPQIPHQLFRTLPRREMPSPLLLALKRHRPHRPPPRLGENHNLLWEITQPQLHLRYVLPRPRQPKLCIVRNLVIDTQTRRRTPGAVPVDGHPGQDLVVRPGIIVGPIMQFFVYPR